MKNIIKNMKFIAAAAVVGATVTGCSLDMLPLNDVVLENYWRDKTDVESVVASCYTALQEREDKKNVDFVTNMIVWGECRSDNTEVGPDVPGALRNLMRGSLKTTNEYCDWSPMYKVINRCNTVLHYAPLVAEKDPNYTPSDLAINVAECKALRAISYLTLIKTFKDVPFTLEPTIDDNVEMRLPQTKFEVILDSLINDIYECRDAAPRRYSDFTLNSARITRPAMYALLAELYLWRASDKNLTAAEQNEYYRKCIWACDWVLNFKIQQYNENNIDGVDLTKLIDTEVWSNYGYPLLSETVGAGGTAFSSIFGTGNSFESIFEVTYYYKGNIRTNESVGLMYGGSDSQGSVKQYITGNEKLMPNKPTGTTFDNVALFPVTTDFRSITSFTYQESGSFDINKYSVRSFETNYRGTGTIDFSNLPSQAIRGNSSMYMGWIVYRMTEIMLFRAEAEIMLANNLDKAAAENAADEEETEGDEPTEENPTGARIRKVAAVDGASLATAEELYEDAFNLITAIYTRSNPAVKTTSSAKAKRSDFTSFAQFEDYLMNERRRELLFEGKRYFDLVRQARREGNTNKFVTKLTSKFGDGGAAVSIKMRQMDFMYMPVWKNQIKVNPNLKQNSAYLDEEQIVNN